jgi:uncharacterized protein with beta-barrel porin domain
VVDTGVNLTSTGTITGGNGGAGGTDGVANRGGIGGAGGAGVTGSSFTLTNSGSIQGGNGGDAGAPGSVAIGAGAGGAGVTGSNLQIINAGTIAGGFAGKNGGAGGAQANAITFTGGINSLELQAGWVITGNVVGATGAGTSNTLILGGDTTQTSGTGATSFNVSNIGPQYQNFTLFQKSGASIWTLTGSGSQAWTVNAGALFVDGSIGSATVSSGATLGGSGTVGAITVLSGGTFAPGPSSGTPGVMTVTGNLAFQSGAIYLVQVNPSTSSTSNVSGTATLGGTVQANFAPGTFLERSYTILSATGGRIGTFGALATLGLPAGFQASLSYTGNTAVLDLSAQLVPPPGPPAPGQPARPPLPVNQFNVATAIDNFFNGGGALPPAFVSLFGLTGSNLTNGLSQLSGEVATGAERAAFQLTNSFLRSLTDPIGCGGINTPAVQAISPFACAGGHSALPFTPEQEAILPPDIALAYASIFKAPPKPIFEQHWSTWGSAYGGSNISNGNATVGSNNVTTDIFGFAAGMDYNFTPDLLAGFALAGAGTNWGLVNGLGTGRSDAFQVGARVISWFGPAYVKAALAFTNNWFTTNRSALGDQLTANFDGQSYGGRIEGGYRYFLLPALGVAPYGALQAQDFHTPAHSEADATTGGFGLNYAAMNATDVRTELGARFDDPTLLYGKPLILFGRLAWAHDFVNNPALSAGFQALPGASFTVNGAPIPHDSALTTAGAELFFSARWSLLAKFDGEFGNGSQTYAGSGALRYTW